MTEADDKHRQLAIQIAQIAKPSEGEALRAWAFELMQLRDSPMPSIQKAKAAITATHRAKVAWPMVKIISKQAKSYGWDQRSTSQKLGISVAAMTLTLFGGANAGIAALGTAVGVPLWVVFGAGAMFARHLYEELGSKK